MTVLKEDLMDLIDVSKLKNLISRAKKEEIVVEKKCCPWKKILGVVAVLAAVGGAAYAVYRYFTAESDDEFLDDFDDDFEDEDALFEEDILDEAPAAEEK